MLRKIHTDQQVTLDRNSDALVSVKLSSINCCTEVTLEKELLQKCKKVTVVCLHKSDNSFNMVYFMTWHYFPIFLGFSLLSLKLVPLSLIFPPPVPEIYIFGWQLWELSLSSTCEQVTPNPTMQSQ